MPPRHFAEDLRLIVHAESASAARVVLDKLANLLADPALVGIESDDHAPEELDDYECLACKSKKKTPT